MDDREVLLAESESSAAKDYLWLHVRELPYFRSLVRAVEARFYENIDLPPPTLDVGCGDGHFAKLAFNRPLEVGLDPWSGPILEAGRRRAYRSLAQGDGGKMPFPAGAFASAVSNSVLEHIPHVELVLQETARVLQTGAPFVFCVPNHNFLPSLSVSSYLDRLGTRSLGDAYRRFFNRISRHQHCDPPEVWQERLKKTGFILEHWWHYLSPRAMHVVEWGHYLGLPSLVTHWLTRRWILAPWRWNLAPTMRWLKPYYETDPRSDAGVYTFFIARKV